MKDPDLFKGNLPEVVWDQLKLVAAEEAENGRTLVIEQCVARVERVVRSLVGRSEALPPSVVRFYAEELHLRIASLIGEAAEDGL